MQAKEIVYDVYFSYSEKDEEKVKEIKKMLEKEKQSIKIFSKHQDLKMEDTWQKEIYEVMVQCRRYEDNGNIMSMSFTVLFL